MGGASEYMYKVCEGINVWAVLGIVIGATALLLIFAFLCLKRNRPTCCHTNPFLCAGGIQAFGVGESEVFVVRENAKKMGIGDVEKGEAKSHADGIAVELMEDSHCYSDETRLIQSKKLEKILEE